MGRAVIVSYARTGLAKSGRGGFNDTHGATMTGHAIKHAVSRAGLEGGEVEDVIIGCGNPEGTTGHNIARDAALRELLEETGLKPSAFWVVPYLSTFYEHRSDAVHLCPMFAAQVRVGAQPALSSEHDAFEWCDADRAAKLLVWPGQREGLRIVHEYIVRGEKAAEITKIL